MAPEKRSKKLNKTTKNRAWHYDRSRGLLFAYMERRWGKPLVSVVCALKHHFSEISSSLPPLPLNVISSYSRAPFRLSLWFMPRNGHDFRGAVSTRAWGFCRLGAQVRCRFIRPLSIMKLGLPSSKRCNFSSSPVGEDLGSQAPDGIVDIFLLFSFSPASLPLLHLFLSPSRTDLFAGQKKVIFVFSTRISLSFFVFSSF